MDAEEIRIVGYGWQKRTRITLPGGRVLNIEPTGLQNNMGYDALPERQKKACRLYKVKEDGVTGVRILSELELEKSKH